MQRNIAPNFTAPYQHSESALYHNLERLAEFTFRYPNLSAFSIDAVAALAGSISALSLVNGSASGAGLGLFGAAAALGSRMLQRNVIGFPLPADFVGYRPAEFEFIGEGKDKATAKMVVEHGEMPRLVVRAQSHYAAGYVEGKMLGPQIAEALRHTDFLYDVVSSGIQFPDSLNDLYNLVSHAKRYASGGSKDNERLADKLADVKRTIPDDYFNEMRGKIDGYDQWCAETDTNAPMLTLDYYILLQILPDFLNYKPFAKGPGVEGEIPGLVAGMACTTIAMRLGSYTAVARVLDWPSHGFAGRSIFQLDKQIEGFKRTVDISTPIVSGGLTVLNEDGLLVEINVSHGDIDFTADKKPVGMPAIFTVRHVAEQASCVNEIQALIDKDAKPLGPFHLTASDGKQTKSFHFYQSREEKGEHASDVLSEQRDRPQLMLVTNHGVQFDGEDSQSVNHRDSDQRKANLTAFFAHPPVAAKLEMLCEKQQACSELSVSDLKELQEILIAATRLPLVRNAQSVLCALYIYKENQLQVAKAASNNMYAQDRNLSEFREIENPSTCKM